MAVRRAAPARHGLAAPADVAADADVEAAFDDALARIRELTLRLWAVREAHRPVRGFRRAVRCGTCRARYPCPTLRALGPLPGRRTRAEAAGSGELLAG